MVEKKSSKSVFMSGVVKSILMHLHTWHDRTSSALVQALPSPGACRPGVLPSCTRPTSLVQLKIRRGEPWKWLE